MKPKYIAPQRLVRSDFMLSRQLRGWRAGQVFVINFWCAEAFTPANLYALR